MEEIHLIQDVLWLNSDMTTIQATIDGVTMFIPDDMENRHRVMIAQWEANGNSITPFGTAE